MIVVIATTDWLNINIRNFMLLLLSRFSHVQLCDPIDSSPPGSPIPGILQARTLEWVAISFSHAWKWKGKVKSLSHVRPSATPWNPLQGSPTLGPPIGAGPVRNGVRSRRWVAGDEKVGDRCRALDKFSGMKTKIIYMPMTAYEQCFGNAFLYFFLKDCSEFGIRHNWLLMLPPLALLTGDLELNNLFS